MAFKISYYTLAKLKNGSVGNVKQSSGVAFTDKKIEEIPAALDEHLAEKNLVGVIVKIENVTGFCLA